MKSNKAAVLFSGGKDSCLALHLAKKRGYEIKYLLSVLPKNFDSFMFHKPCLKLLEKQAEMLGVELMVMEGEGVEGREVEDLKNLIEKVKNKIEVIVVGGIASSYQGNRIKKICEEQGYDRNLCKDINKWMDIPSSKFPGCQHRNFRHSKKDCDFIASQVLKRTMNINKAREAKNICNLHRILDRKNDKGCGCRPLFEDFQRVCSKSVYPTPNFLEKFI